MVPQDNLQLPFEHTDRLVFASVNVQLCAAAGVDQVFENSMCSAGQARICPDSHEDVENPELSSLMGTNQFGSITGATDGWAIPDSVNTSAPAAADRERKLRRECFTLPPFPKAPLILELDGRMVDARADDFP